MSDDYKNLRNLIFFGAPGTGKSYNLNAKAIELVNGKIDSIKRVTFHPDYSYANFVGSYKPKMNVVPKITLDKINEIIGLIKRITWENIRISTAKEVNNKKINKLFKRNELIHENNNDLNELNEKLLNFSDKEIYLLLYHCLNNYDFEDIAKYKIVCSIVILKEIKKINATAIPVLVGYFTKNLESGENTNISKDNVDSNTLAAGKLESYSNALAAGKQFKMFLTEIGKSICSENSDLEYKFVPGPFMRMYVEAKLHSDITYVLIIEEINRANPSAVFGDLFQLLDRDNDGTSLYPIAASEDIKNYLAENRIYESDLSLPKNLYIWATMNSADQGVYPMDTAFKRRWEFEYLGIDNEESYIEDKSVSLNIPNNKPQKFCWNSLRKAINNYLSELNINEDKQLGPYFIYVKSNDKDEIDSDDFIRTFKSKVLMYLFEDAARHKRSQLFSGIDDIKEVMKNKNKRYSDLCKAFEEHGINIFNKRIVNEVNNDTKSNT